MHHIKEKRFAKRCKNIKISDTNEMYSIALDKSTHRNYTKQWRKYCKYGKQHTAKEVLQSV